MGHFSFSRFRAIVSKEFIQMRRDRLTFGMLIGIPLIQLILFGFAINSDPRNLPTAILAGDNGPFTRSVVAAMKNSNYYEFIEVVDDRASAQDLIRRGDVQFVLTIPENFEADLLRGEAPVLLLEADATDPAATSGAMSAFREIVNRALSRHFKGPLAYLNQDNSAFTIRLHAEYNPEAVTQYNIVPGLMGVILTMTLVMITSLAITRETERGTMENLLSTPIRPLEIILGKIIPYIMVAYIQIFLILSAAKILFDVPMHGSITLLLLVSLLFIAATLTVGVTFSTMARNQLQAVQLSIFFFLPSLLLSGFMFPFRGMPKWAQLIGSGLPLTHYLRIVRGILLKGNGFMDTIPHAWPILVFWIIALTIGLKRFRQTLD